MPTKKVTKKKLNLATAEIADGSVKPAKSVYELCGITTNSYRESKVEEYRAKLDNMDLIQLQDEAYAKGVPASHNKTQMILRLEEKFVKDVRKFNFEDPAPRRETADQAVLDQAKRILSAGSNHR